MLIGQDTATSATGITNFRIRKRNSGDTADVWSQRFALSGSNNGTGQSLYTISARIQFAANERLVVEVVTVVPAGMIVNANIWTQGPF